MKKDLPIIFLVALLLLAFWRFNLDFTLTVILFFIILSFGLQWDSRISLMAGVFLFFANQIFGLIDRPDLISRHLPVYGLVLLVYAVVDFIYRVAFLSFKRRFALWLVDPKVRNRYRPKMIVKFLGPEIKLFWRYLKIIFTQFLDLILKIKISTWLRALTLFVAFYLFLAVWQWQLINVAVILFLLVSLLYSLSAVWPVGLGVTVLAAVAVSLFFKKNDLAEYLANYAYYFWLLGVIIYFCQLLAWKVGNSRVFSWLGQKFELDRNK
ncbi:MAG: hypothetical protein WCT37_05415 [Patescibacteria group bacterium]|jgi:hypothetical protein